MWESSENYCDLKYTAPSGLQLGFSDFLKPFLLRFYKEGLTNNLGKLTLSLADFMASQGWALMLCNGGSVTPHPEHAPNELFRHLAREI